MLLGNYSAKREYAAATGGSLQWQQGSSVSCRFDLQHVPDGSLKLFSRRDIHTFGVYVVMYEIFSRELEKYQVPKAPKAMLAGGFSGFRRFGFIHDCVSSVSIMRYFRNEQE